MSSTSPQSISEQGATAQRITKQRSLPDARAITGGFLVMVAALGTFVATTGATGDNRQDVVVASRDLAPGTRISESDLTIARMVLTPSAASHVASRKSSILGNTTLGPVRSGEIIQSGLLVAKQSASSLVEVSIALPQSRALGAALRAGESVDVFTTDKSNSNAPAKTAVLDAVVIRQDSANAGLGHSGDLTITLGVASRQDAAVIVAAADQGQITLVRSTGYRALDAQSDKQPNSK